MITDHYNAALSHLLCVTLVSLDNEVAIINTTTLKKSFWKRQNISDFDLEYKVSTHVKVFKVKIRWKFESNAKQPLLKMISLRWIRNSGAGEIAPILN